MIAVPIVILVLVVIAVLAAARVRSANYARGGEGACAIGPHVSLRLMGGVAPPEGIEHAARAIDAALSTRYGAWWHRVDLVIEWHSFGSVITGPFVRTGFQDRRTGRACGAPTPPITDQTAEAVARVVGTVRVDKLWPWTHRERWTAVIMDGRSGASRREVLAGDDSAGRPRVPAERSSLFYEIAWRIAPLGVANMLAGEIGKHAKTWRELEASMKRGVK